MQIYNYTNLECCTGRVSYTTMSTAMKSFVHSELWSQATWASDIWSRCVQQWSQAICPQILHFGIYVLFAVRKWTSSCWLSLDILILLSMYKISMTNSPRVSKGNCTPLTRTAPSLMDTLKVLLFPVLLQAQHKVLTSALNKTAYAK